MSDYIKDSAIKRTISDREKLRSSADSIEAIGERMNELIRKVIEDAADRARADDRKTIMKEDATAALEEIIGRETLTPEQVLVQILRQAPVDLRDIANGIDEELKRLKL